MTPTGSANAPEAVARLAIDKQLEASGWLLQHRDEMNLNAASAVAVREFKLRKNHGFVDYMLFLDGHAVGVCEAKPAGFPVFSVEHQTKMYVDGLPEELDALHKPLPFSYISTGDETAFINHLDPHARTRPIFSFHRPDTLREWLSADTLDAWLKRPGGFYTAADGDYAQEYDVAPDGRLLMLQTLPASAELIVIPNWAAELRAKTR